MGLRVPGLQTRFSCWCEELISVCIYAFVHVRGAEGRRVRMLLFFRRHDASQHIARTHACMHGRGAHAQSQTDAHVVCHCALLLLSVGAVSGQ